MASVSDHIGAMAQVPAAGTAGRERIEGFDLARSLAFLGMVFVNWA